MRRGNATTLKSKWFAAILIAASFLIAPLARAQQRSAQPSAIELAQRDRAFEKRDASPASSVLTSDDEKFLDDLEQRGIKYFVDTQDPVTGLMPDRAVATGPTKDVASVAAVGFGLTAYCIGDERGWLPHQEAYDRSMKVLRFLRDKAPQEHGHFYHFLNMHTGARQWDCEVSNIDTALLMAGVLTVRQHFAGTDLATLANELYERVDWPWMLNDKSDLLRCDWKPEKGFSKGDWGAYSECPTTIILMSMGSKTHPLPAKCWQAWKREPVMTYAGLSYVQCPPLFTHQYPQCWFDLRGMHDNYVDYYRNSQLATIAQRQWCMDELSKKFTSYGSNVWGITASDAPHSYESWGGPPISGPIDGTVVPCAAAGSLPFEPRLCLDALEHMRRQYGEKAYLKYGFVDSFNPETNWYNADVLGIDVGPTVLMAENCRSQFVWKTFMSSPEASAALKAAGFKPLNQQDMEASAKSSLFGASRQSDGSKTAGNNE